MDALSAPDTLRLGEPRSVKQMADRSYMIPSRDGLANLVRVPPCVSFRVANFAIFLVRNIA